MNVTFKLVDVFMNLIHAVELDIDDWDCVQNVRDWLLEKPVCISRDGFFLDGTEVDVGYLIVEVARPPQEILREGLLNLPLSAFHNFRSDERGINVWRAYWRTRWVSEEAPDYAALK